jgi:cation diffusion facilitator CzcD-associated flavoprotein CzcO
MMIAVMTEVAIIGAGPAGLVAARYLTSEGFEPVLFEQGATIGGQWSGDRARSGVWPSMRTNTSRILTAFSDLPHADGSQVYPSNQTIRDYLRAYAERFSLSSRVHLGMPVVGLERHARSGRWLVRTPSGERAFAYVVVATGAFHRWRLPAVPGLASFSGAGGVAHTYQYADADSLRGLRVLIAGGAISALEIASDLAMAGASRVTVTVRRQRYVLPKLAAGTPTDHTVFTRFHALAEEAFPAERVNQIYTETVLRLGGRPEHYGAPAARATVADAGITLCQHFLPLVAEGRIDVRPWMTSVDGQLVRFSDGSASEFDAILFGTGFDLHLPFLAPAIRDTLGLDAEHIDLHLRTFHPALPGLAFAGLWDQAGPYFPPIELQARWIAYSWSGAVPAPSEDEMTAGVAAYRARRGSPQKGRMNVVTLQFARAAGVEPSLERWPRLSMPLLFGPLSPVSFRLEGRDALPDAPVRVAADAQAFGCASGEPTAAQCKQLDELAAASRSESLRGALQALIDQSLRASTGRRASSRSKSETASRPDAG